MKIILKIIILIMSIYCIIIQSCTLDGYKSKNETIVKKVIKVYMIDGRSKVISIDVPTYTYFTINSIRGSYRLSYWVYCLRGTARCEETVMQGVVDFEIIN